MSNASLRFDKRGLNKIIARLDDKAARDQIRQIPGNRATVALVAQAIADNFNKEGPGWAPLKPETIRRSAAKRKHKGGGTVRRILRDSGLLFRAATTPGFHGSSDTHTAANIVKSTDKYLTYRVDLVYAGVHNKGKPSRGIPKREFMTVRDEWKKRLSDFLAEQIFRVISDRMLKGGS